MVWIAVPSPMPTHVVIIHLRSQRNPPIGSKSVARGSNGNWRTKLSSDYSALIIREQSCWFTQLHTVTSYHHHDVVRQKCITPARRDSVVISINRQDVFKKGDVAELGKPIPAKLTSRRIRPNCIMCAKSIGITQALGTDRRLLHSERYGVANTSFWQTSTRLA